MCIFYNLTSASSEPQRSLNVIRSQAPRGLCWSVSPPTVASSLHHVSVEGDLGCFHFTVANMPERFSRKTCVLGLGEARGSGRAASLFSFRSHCPAVSRVAVHLLRLQDTRRSSLCCASSRTAVSATRRSGGSVVMPHRHLIHIPFGPWPFYSLEGVSSRCLCHLHMPSPHWFVGLVHSGRERLTAVCIINTFPQSHILTLLTVPFGKQF